MKKAILSFNNSMHAIIDTTYTIAMICRLKYLAAFALFNSGLYVYILFNFSKLNGYNYKFLQP